MLAAQFYTLREQTKSREGLVDALRRVREMGYDGVQFSAVGCMNSGEVSAEEARKMLDDLELRCVATHRPWESLRDETESEIAFHRTLGCDYTAIGGLWSGYEQSADGYRRFLYDAAPVIAMLEAAGIRFGFHNHAHEFVRDPEAGMSLYDVLIEEGGSLQLEVDTYWVQHAGVDPVQVLDRLPGRIAAVHLKDKEVVHGDGPVMAPVGEGNLDWKRILESCRRGGTEFFIVEQDECRRDPFDCLRSSCSYLRKIMVR
jgi:sugar phosphate isomerase/epimerase